MACTSTAPMSDWLPGPAATLVRSAGRVSPRWSSVSEVFAASSTGLDGPGSSVSVGPPLSASAPSAGSTPVFIDPGVVTLIVAVPGFSIRSNSASIVVATVATSAAALSAAIEFFSVTLFILAVSPAPWLEAIVTPSSTIPTFR